jgi:DeoR/GlpR family transcriptional regulator of sugar metabolism
MVMSDAGAEGSQSHAMRRNAIRDQLIAAGAVRIQDLARSFGVTVMTIHRDLNALEQEGWLRKVRGGAVVEPTAQIDTTVRYRRGVRANEKLQIGRCALRHVNPGDALMVDDSTTTLCLVRLLPGLAPLTVMTSFLPAVNALAGERDIELIALGGVYSARYERFCGPDTLDAIDRLRADTFFTSSTAVMGDGGVCHTSVESVALRRAMFSASSRRILLMDHSKFARRAVHRLGLLTDFDVVIVDGSIAAADLAMMREMGVTVEVAGDGGALTSPVIAP